MRRAWAPEAPHLYHIGGYYYLMIAEGGTEHFHSVVIARCETVDGWYEGFKGNPVMTHRHFGKYYPIDNVGHADLVDTPDGNWYAVMLGSRLLEGPHKNLGRETWICPVDWEDDWPVFSPGTGKVEWKYPADPKLPWTPLPKEPERDDFDSLELGLHWSFWGVPYQDYWKIENSCLKLKCLPRPMTRELHGFDVQHPDMSKDDCISFLGRRQRNESFDLMAEMHFAPREGEAAGIMLLQAANHQLRLENTCIQGRYMLRLVQATTKQKGLPFLPGYEAQTKEEVLVEQEINTDILSFRVKARKQQYTFFCGVNEYTLKPMGPAVDVRNINPEEIGGMIGTMIGMFATANGKDSQNEAAFEYFEIIPVNKSGGNCNDKSADGQKR